LVKEKEPTATKSRDYRRLLASTRQVPGAFAVLVDDRPLESQGGSSKNGSAVPYTSSVRPSKPVSTEEEEEEDLCAAEVALRQGRIENSAVRELVAGLLLPPSNSLSSTSNPHRNASVPVMMGRQLVVPLGRALVGSDHRISSSSSSSDGINSSSSSGGSNGDCSAVPAPTPSLASTSVETSVEGVCCWGFEELCGREVGAADYKALCDRFHTVVLCEVPVLSWSKDHNRARRFVTLVDELYEHQVRLLVASAAATPDELFQLDVSSAGGIGTDRLGGPTAPTATRQPAAAAKLSGRPLPSSVARGAEFGRVQLLPPTICDTDDDDGEQQQQQQQQGSGGAGDGSGGGRGKDRVVADAAQSTLVLEGELASVQELGFAFRRAASRLIEMGGAPYHQTHADAWPDAASLLPRKGQ